ncbi:MAG: MFS transporter [Clostridia bacterium]|nr:MFS transporter [Clostridia bacterium]
MTLFHQFKWTRKACYLGYITQSVCINFVPLLFLTFEHTFGITLGQISLLIGINFAVQLLSDMTVAKIADWMGLRRAAVTAQLIAVAGLVSLAVLPFLLPNAFVGLIIAVLLCGIGGGCNEVLISPIIEACPGDGKASSMSLLHSFYCWGQAGVILLSVGFFALFGIERWPILSCLLGLIPFMGALLFTAVPLAQPEEEEGGTALRHLFRSRAFFWCLLLIFAAGAAEMIMGQWASAFAESGLGASKTVGDLLGPCFFAIMMGGARILYAKIASKVSLVLTVALSALLCILSYLMAALVPIPLVALLSCGLCGLSVGIFWPGTYSLAAARLPLGGVPMFALLAIAGDCGCLLGPSIAGGIADRFGGDIRFAFLLSTVLPCVILLCAARLWLLSKKKNGKP